VPYDLRTERDDAARVHGHHAAVVVLLDVEEVDRLGDAGVLIELARVGPQVRVVDQAPEVALEVADVDRIEPDQRGEQTPIGFGDPVTREVAPA
jgi:hypothetical protein